MHHKLARTSLIALSAAAAVGAHTPPEEVLGFKPGADFHLANYEQSIAYFDLLASETDRMQMFDLGPTSEGRRAWLPHAFDRGRVRRNRGG